MKKITAILLSAALVSPALTAAPAMAKDKHAWDRGKPAASKNAWKSFRKGDRFDRRYARNYRQIDYRSYKRLKAPPRGYQYVRSGNDVLLVGITSGIVASVLTGMFR